ncbi:Mariner Mos1 transposase [Eumeta japonica]|uniref:Mariner Mos1 transposase n=1 Tax=Eumeta variegata TaxID=151549 RepID=A0A4C1W2Z3_EUMVA|nr:Mariner Mos1 transposase [Eumeta japonica]
MRHPATVLSPVNVGSVRELSFEVRERCKTKYRFRQKMLIGLRPGCERGKRLPEIRLALWVRVREEEPAYRCRKQDKDRSGRPKIYEDAELEELLEEDSSQIEKELALTLEVTQKAVSRHLISLGMIHKQARHKKKLFYIESSLVMKIGYIMIIQKEENHGDYLATRQHPEQNEYLWEKTHAVYLVGSAECGILRIP